MGSDSEEEKSKKTSTIPAFVLRRIFPKDCAKVREEGGFYLTLVNNIQPFLFSAPPVQSYMDAISIKLDGKKLDPDKFYIRYKGVESPYTNLEFFDGGRVNLNDEIEVVYKSEEQITPEPHVLDIHIDSPEPIRIKFKTVFRKPFY